MSIYSGKCDLYDYIAGSGGWYDRDGNPVQFGQEGIGAYYSDEYRDFLAFKKETAGMLFQHKKMKLTPWNHKEIKTLCPEFDYHEHTRVVEDKRSKTGQREEKYLTYTYWGKEYTLKELNKKGIWVTITIHFNTLLDLIPYYPYIVAMACHGIVYISQQSFVDEEVDGHLEHGWYSEFWEHYKKELQDHYREIVLTYFNPEGREHIEEVEFDENGIGKVSKPIDENFELEWRWEDGKKHSHWTSPKIKNAEKGLIQMSKEDLNNYIGKKALVYYVEYKDYSLNLG